MQGRNGGEILQEHSGLIGFQSRAARTRWGLLDTEKLVCLTVGLPTQDALQRSTTNDPSPTSDLGQKIATFAHVLGWTRDGRSRLPGATDTNPLGGGLRIGKTDEHGSDCDGQYHHYLTVWMFALNRMARASGDMKYNRQAVQLARAIHPKFFVDRAAKRPRMVWKMSMDLSVPLVTSEGNLDPIDGYVVFRVLQATAIEAGDGEVLGEEIDDYRRVMERKGEHFVSSDPLDLGMTLWTAHWFSEKESWAANLETRCFEQLCQCRYHALQGFLLRILAKAMLMFPA